MYNVHIYRYIEVHRLRIKILENWKASLCYLSTVTVNIGTMYNMYSIFFSHCI